MLTSLYIHIPFCEHICTYCDFHKELATFKKKEQYIKAICKELIYKQADIAHVKTIYIGGGTPLSLDISLLEELLITISSVIDVPGVIEYTIETNPNNITDEKAALLKAYDVNRVSIGVQTFQAHHLAFLGRDHQYEDIITGINILKQHQFPNISVDMMFSLINQTMNELRDDIEQVLTLDIDHISYYSLILEEKTKLHQLYEQNAVDLNDEDTEGLMYSTVIDTLVNAGYHHYEISNFAKAGHESLHNKTYWLGLDYLGIGSGSHSYFHQKRFHHLPNVSKYTKNMHEELFDEYYNDDTDPLAEELMLGLRLMNGINIVEINHKYQISLFEKYPKLLDYIQDGLLVIIDDQLRLTRQGILLGNLIFEIFVEVA